jgi:hypothetical protein
MESTSGKGSTMEVVFHLHTAAAGEAIEAFMACGDYR